MPTQDPFASLTTELRWDHLSAVRHPDLTLVHADASAEMTHYELYVTCVSRLVTRVGLPDLDSPTYVISLISVPARAITLPWLRGWMPSYLADALTCNPRTAVALSVMLDHVADLIAVS